MKVLLFVLTVFSAITASATEMRISIELPEHQYEGRFYPPYVTGWIEKDKKMVDTLFIWYHFGNKEQNNSTEWLKSLKKWWRRGGRSLDIHKSDAIAGATKKPGTHVEAFAADNKLMKNLKQGINYKLVIEASREKGGNESVAFPFTITDSELTFNKSGESELGKISVTISP